MNVLRLASTAVVLLLASAAVAAYPRRNTIVQPTPAASVLEIAPLSSPYRTVTHVVADGETAGEIVRMLGAPTEMLHAAGSGFNRIAVGDRFHLDYLNGDIWRLRLENGGPSVLTITRVPDEQGARYVTESVPVPYQIETASRQLTIESSLWQAAEAVGLAPRQIMEMAQVFEYDIDFNTELVKGATIQMVVEQLTDTEGNTRFGQMAALSLKNGKDTYNAFRYRLKDGKLAWFDAEGKALRKTFLRFPIEFMRVGSGFSKARFHPILKINRPHLGVDLGAPTGTPVRTVAEGVVVEARYAGGHGNHVVVDHGDGRRTGYSHLSKILVKKGQKVSQGDLVGKVGSTGLSTGPHLHWEYMVNGKHVDPMQNKPPNSGTVLPDAERAAFMAARDQLLPLLNGQTQAD